MSNLKEKAADYFNRYRSSNVCYITSDSRVFHDAGSAAGFANTLKDNKVSTFKRSAFNVADAKDSNVKEKTKQLETLELVNSNYQEIKALVKFFELEVADQKAETLIEALAAYKLKIQD